MSMSEPLPPDRTAPPAGTRGPGSDTGESGGTAEAAQREGRELAGAAVQEARSTGQTAKEQAGRVTDDARTQARGLLDSAAESVEEQAEEQVHRLADVLRRASSQAEALADGRPEEASDVDGYVRELAGTLGDIAGRIDRLGARGSVEELQHFARRRPGVFLAGAAAAGFVASRFLRNAGSGDGRTDASVDERPDALPPTTPAATAEPARPVAPPPVPPAGPTALDDLPGQNRGGPTSAPPAEAP